MANVLLGVTGSVAAIKTPEMVGELRAAGHAVKVVVTGPALYFFDPQAVADVPLYRDEDDWPAEKTGQRWQRQDPVLHIELRRWADVLLIAPVDANTLAKFALGICDNCLTCVYRAWDRTRPIVLAPAMNTLMWEHPATNRHLLQIAADMGYVAPQTLSTMSFIAWLSSQAVTRLRVVPPVVKRLACDDVGAGALAELRDIVAAIANRELARPS